MVCLLQAFVRNSNATSINFSTVLLRNQTYYAEVQKYKSQAYPGLTNIQWNKSREHQQVIYIFFDAVVHL